jgi:hypothetical protein
MSWREEFWHSIKSFDTEEKLDLYFYRPVGFLIAKTAKPLKLTPTQLTLVGLVLGISAGFFYRHNQSTDSLIIGSALFILSGLFDSADGQLARMVGQSSKLGLVLDGVCDNFVFASVYINSAITMMDVYGAWIFPIAVLAGVCHSMQSSMLDFYNREYLYFGYGKVDGDYWNPTLTEAIKERETATGLDSLMIRLRFSWLWQQNKLTTRTEAFRYKMQSILRGPQSKEFQTIYRDTNRTILRFWRLMGPNFHTIMIIVCVFLRRFDLYLICVDIGFLSIALLTLRFFQRRQDDALSQALKTRNLL